MGLIRKEQIENGGNIAFKDEDLDLGAFQVLTTGQGSFGSVAVDDEAYGAGWDSDLTVPTKNAVYDALQTISGAVSSVNGNTGVVVLDTDDIAEGTNLYFTDERAQDAIGTMVDTTLVYTDGTPLLSRAAISGDITIAGGSNTAAITSGSIINDDVNASAAIAYSKLNLSGSILNADINSAAAIAYSKLAALTASRVLVSDGSGVVSASSVTPTTLAFLDATSSVQTQLDAKIPYTETSTATMSFVVDEDTFVSNSATKVPTQQSVKAYVDAIADLSGDLTLIKEECDLATTANITLSGEQTIDGTLTSSSRVLVKDQSTVAENGIYVTGAGAWTRATDYDAAAEVKRGTSTFILGGTVNESKYFVMVSPDVVTLNTDPITFAAIRGLTTISDTDELPEGLTNLYYTSARVLNTVQYETPFATDVAYVMVTGTDTLLAQMSAATFKVEMDIASFVNPSIQGYVPYFQDDEGVLNSSGLFYTTSGASKLLKDASGNDTYMKFTNQGTVAEVEWKANVGSGGFAHPLMNLTANEATFNYTLTKSVGNPVGGTSAGNFIMNAVATDGITLDTVTMRGVMNGIDSTGGSEITFQAYNGFFGIAGSDGSGSAFMAKLKTSNLTADRIMQFRNHAGVLVTDTAVALSDGASVTLNADLGNVFTLTALGNRTILAPTGTPYDGQKITIRHTASGAARTLTLTTGSLGAFRYGTDITTITQTELGKTDYIGCVYNSSASRWDVVSFTKGF